MIICAALLLENKNQEEVVLPCWRHGIGYQILHELYVDAKVLKEGFINHNGEFLDRYDAFAHAKECGQLPQSTRWYKEGNRESELYSEDLY
jgi:hypothetical protein